ncbi:pentapeptide repeat-containing protein [Persicimonas caeni]|uniref:Pentapeptide repeat-containing protein n=1 Tax=Persicimonas caeni TaxID=2292766 RepID=A0A4Y6Q064_PERCE|nr:pentapeptide repeat-containing protein [Persicimonas caeni]QED34616.1 pentapeptide repeat-containing protein [Persicimonas caeni]
MRVRARVRRPAPAEPVARWRTAALRSGRCAGWQPSIGRLLGRAQPAELTRAELTRAELTRAELTRAELARAELTRAEPAQSGLARPALLQQKPLGARRRAGWRRR